ncbi:MAG: hypothetical protein ABIZ34_08020, partial [Candidatus Limnocylindrales bacterium]
MTVDPPGYIEDWSPIPDDRYARAQQGERQFWMGKSAEVLNLSAKYYFFAGFHRWTVKRNLMHPFRIDPSRPGNFQIAPDDIAGTDILDIGPGPASISLSLVPCA